MKRNIAILLVMLMFLSFTACSKGNKVDTWAQKLEKAEEFGVVPEEYKAIVEGDLLNGLRIAGYAGFDGRFLTDEFVEDGREIALYDSFGKLLAKHFIPTDELGYRLADLLLATSDGGFIYAIDADVASDANGGVLVTPTRIFKCGADGSVEWTAETSGLIVKDIRRAFEKNGAYYFFGEYSDLPAGGYDHIVMLKLGLDGKELRQSTVSGSDFDTLCWVDETETGFTLHVNSQSRDGDFFKLKKENPPYTGRYFVVKTDLELEEKDVARGKTDYCDRWYYSAGTLKGENVEQNRTMKDIPGYVKLVIDNGDTYLVVSENNTDIFEKTPPLIGSLWYYTETVYSVFDSDGKLIARRTFDSSPDWELTLKAFNAAWFQE